MRFLQSHEIDKIIKDSPVGRNTNFLKSSHNLWKRFKNYSKSPPLGYEAKKKIVSIIFTTFNKNSYTNLYEIVTIQNEEGNGYARKLWIDYLSFATLQKGMTRLKISCTPSSITWHLENGLIFWGIDASGSLKSDQPLSPTIEAQKKAREKFVSNPSLAMPSYNIVQILKKSQLDNYSFTRQKRKTIEEAITKTGRFWLGDYLE